MTLYLLDANVLIRANGDYYPLDRIPAFWVWLLGEAGSGRVKMPIEIYDEVARSSDELGRWLRAPAARKAIVLEEPTLGAAAALGMPDRIVVSREVSAPAKRR